jgi:hypothetical protein
VLIQLGNKTSSVLIIKQLTNPLLEIGSSVFHLTLNQFVDRRADQAQKEIGKYHPDRNVQHLGPEHVYLLYGQNNEGRDVPPSREVFTFAIV